MSNRLLIVDDEPFVLSALTRLLRRDGYEVITANAPSRGLAILQEQSVGVIISDYRMPEMDGVQLLRRAREVAPSAIRIILSGYAETHAILSAVNDGGIHKYLTKPWNDEQIRLEIKSGFELYRLAVTNRELQETLTRQNEELRTLTKSLAVEQDRQREIFRTTIEMLVSLPKLNSPKEVRQSDRVQAICRATGEHLGLTDDELAHLDLAARLHDVGNLAVDIRILLKSGALDPEETRAVQQHAVVPGHLLSGVPGMETVVQLLRSHHENFDGSGYPDRLSGSSIPALSRILRLVDAYEALRSHRPYRESISAGQAITHIEREAGRAFDPVLIEPFKQVIKGVEGIHG
ncbi:MAG TPA: HD domain-containing phosphohydrolase [Nitrospiria bacterium]|nr:HD domain-containing phosphohydrolase [Nitrospiria bacterium]